jgi:hypothetical protein
MAPLKAAEPLAKETLDVNAAAPSDTSPKRQPLVPRTTDPLTKFIRTGEGVLVFAFNLAMVLVPIVSDALTPQEAVKWAAIVNAVTVVSRTGLKIVSLAKGITTVAPQQLNPNVTVDVQQLAAELAKQLPADLRGKVSMDGIAGQVEQDGPTVQQLVTDAENFTGQPRGVAPALTASERDGQG